MTGLPSPHGDSSRHEPQALRSERFAVVRKLGEGGMGTVYEAVDRERSMRVALKTLRELSPEALPRFKGEFRKLQDLHHPNLVSLGELVEEQGRWFFTMELVHGSDFLSYVRGLSLPEQALPTVRRGSLAAAEPPGAELPTTRLPSAELPTAPSPLLPSEEPPPPAAPVASFPHLDEQRLRSALGQLALGLRALHRAGKVHRDIKPSNILVTPEGRVVLLDFGILSDVEGDETWSSSVVVGTASYMAPEQARGAPPSPQADWYSVGVLLYQALTGRKPYVRPPQGPLSELPRPSPPHSLVPGLPEDLTRLCEALLSPEPHLRPQGEEVLRHLGVEQAAREEAWATTALPFVGRRAELQALHQALVESQQGTSVVIRVEGESGVGKSRLVRRFLEEVVQRHPGTVVLNGRCYERESVPYKGVDGVVDGLVRYLSGRGQALAPQVLTEDLSALARLFPVLQALERVRPGGGEAEPGSPMQLRLSAFATLRRLLARLALHHPLVLSVDDVQWAGEDTLAVLEEVLQAPGLLLVSTLRRGAESASPAGLQERRWWSGARALSLEGLPPQEATLLASQLLGQVEQGAPPGTEEVQRIAQESGGHPLFIEALVRHQQGKEERPVHLEEALWARVRRLEPGAQGLLELLAVASTPLPQGVAARAVALGPSEYARLTASLRGARLAMTSGPADTDLVELLHDRVRQAVLRYLAPPERRQWHARLAQVLEEGGAGRAEARALHWLEAGEHERAAHCCVQAAQESAQALAFLHAAHLYRQALELGAWEPAERRRLHLARAEALGHAGRGREAAEAFLALAEAVGKDEASALRRHAAEQYLRSGYIDEGLATVHQVLAELGLSYPERRWQAVLAGLWQRLRLRPWRLWRQRPRQAASEQQRMRLEVLHFLVSSLMPINPLQASAFAAGYLREALDSGDSLHVCKALGLELVRQAAMGPARSRYLHRLEEQLKRLAALHEEEGVLQAEVSLRLAIKSNMVADFRQAREYFERTLAQLQGQAAPYWLLSGALGVGSITLAALGELGEMRQRLELPAAEAWERGDLLTLANLELGVSVMRWLAADEPEQGRRRADAVAALWSRRAQYQRIHHTISHLKADLYEGQEEAALRRADEAWPYLLSMGSPRGVYLRLLSLRARARLGVAAASGGPQAEALLRAVLADCRDLERMNHRPARGIAALLRAGVASVRRGPEAAEAYAHAARRMEEAGMLLHASIARWRQGELLGGEQGQRLVTEAREWMRQRGILRPERMIYMYTPRLQR